MKILTKKPISPSQTEIKINKRARSAKLRAGKKL
jgi:16S rRNA C1402 N4-methylase RsmH